MVADIAKAKDKIGSKLMLNFETPILHHARPPEPRRGIVRTSLETSVKERRVVVIGWWREGRESCIQGAFASHRHRTKVVS